MGDHFPSRAEQLLRQFYEWELRGRGWDLWAAPVRLEPPFRPFLGYEFRHRTIPDDGRKPTLLSTLVERLRLALTPEAGEAPPPREDSEPEPGPEPADEAPLTHLQVLLPEDSHLPRERFDQFLLSLAYCRQPVCLEIIGRSDAITIQVTVADEDLGLVEPQLAVLFPEAVFAPEVDTLTAAWFDSRSGSALAVDFGLSREFMLPLAPAYRSETNTLVGILGTLGALSGNETAVLQVIFQAVRQPWAQSAIRALTRADGGHFFSGAPEFMTETKRKLSRPLYSTVIRIACCAPSEERTWQLTKGLAGALGIFANPLGNELIPLDNDGYDLEGHLEDLFSRRSRRSGMILNSEELVSFIQFPSPSVRASKLKRLTRRTKAAPGIACGEGALLGVNVHNGQEREVRISRAARLRHMHVVGASGTGKSTFLRNLIQQDMAGGGGLAVLDPHGDLIDQVLGQVPEDRLEDLILFDPADDAWPIGFNILSAHSDLEKNLLASDLVAVFRRLSTSWGDQMTSVLGNAILAFLESSRGGTLADMRRFLVEPAFRAQFLATVQDPEVVYYWQREFPLLSGKPQAPLLTRLDAFLRPRTIRYMVAQQSNRLDFAEMMKGRKIFLAKLSQGAIGEENAYLLGSLLVSKIHQLVMGRQGLKEGEREPFFLYIDEFHHFVTPSMAAILTGARKYGLGLILAHQELRQVENQSADVGSAVIANPYARVCFRLGDHDARKLADGFSFFDSKDLQNLGTGEAICRVERADFDFNLSVPAPAEVDEGVREEKRRKVVALTRGKYATPRAEVEKALAAARAPIVGPAGAPESVESVKMGKRERAATSEQDVQGPASPADHRPSSLEPPRISARPQTLSSEPVHSLGRGGPRHKYLQHLIKQWAEGMGYKATIEKPTRDGDGSVDIALEKPGRRVACEVCVGSSVEQETKNLKKCLADEYDYVAVVSQEGGRLDKLRRTLLAGVGEADAARARFFTPEELFSFLQGLEASEASNEQVVKGYKVKVNYRPVDPQDVDARKRAISQVIVEGVKRMRSDRNPHDSL